MQPSDHILSQIVCTKYVIPVPAFPSINTVALIECLSYCHNDDIDS